MSKQTPASSLTLTTWNINSIRLRMPLVAKFVRERAPDIICFQETKCRDAEFPFSALRDMGFQHIEIHGQKGYHGVAIASRAPLVKLPTRDFCNKGDARHVAAVFEFAGRRIALHNVYTPAGGDAPDRQLNEKFGHKLDFLDEMAAPFELGDAEAAILAGDFNVAPLEHDVWSHKALLSVVSHTPIEVEKLTHAITQGKWVDLLRKFKPADQKLYTWWSYRSPDWAKADKGRRLDHVWASPAIADLAASMEVFKEARGWERPSDHAPVSVTLRA